MEIKKPIVIWVEESVLLKDVLAALIHGCIQPYLIAGMECEDLMTLCASCLLVPPPKNTGGSHAN